MENILKMIETADNLHRASCNDFISEEAQDEAYLEYHKIVAQIAEEIQEITNGKIDSLIAKRMAHFKRAEIRTLLLRLSPQQN